MDIIAGKVFLTALALFVAAFVFLYERHGIPDWVDKLVAADVVVGLLAALGWIWL